jgi:hypothetical protein
MLWERVVDPEVRSPQSIAPSVVIEGYSYLVSAERVDERFRPSEGRVYADRVRLIRSRVPTLRDRLPADLRDAPAGSEPDDPNSARST